MGNGNFGCFLRLFHRLVGLLTPHGEREQLRILCAREVQKSS